MRPSAALPSPERRKGATLAAALVLALVLYGNLALGRVMLSPDAIAGALLKPSDNVITTFVWDLRLPRALVGIVCGASLAVAGALMQALLHNDLAAPDIVGMTSGTAFGVVVSSVFIGVSSAFQPFFGLAGGCLAAAVTLLLAYDGTLQPMRLILAGLAAAALFWAGINAALVMAGPEAGALFFWLVGGLAGRSWLHFFIMLPWAVAGLALAMLLAPGLNLLALGDQPARALGVRVGWLRLGIIVAVMALTAGVVAVAGPIAFVGLTVPHVVRRIYGIDHGTLLPMAALHGAAFLSLADLCARFLGGPYEVPVGLFTALIGGPLMLMKVMRA